MYVIQAHRTAGSVCGAAERPVRSANGVVHFDTAEEAAEYCDRLNRSTASPNVYYTVKEAGR